MHYIYERIISVGNLLEAWQEFVRNKKKRKDVQEFQLHSIDNIINLHYVLKNKTYRHSLYEYFRITDPKLRDIHKASVQDRLVHHAVCRVLYPYFNKKFIHDSYSCRLGKGSHKAINRLRSFAYIESRNHTRTIWALKCDVKKFFASIDHDILLQILSKHIKDENVLFLLETIINSFNTVSGKGLPLGNLTSQLLVNIYMNEFDQFVKRGLKIKHYIRFADDFILLSHDKSALITNIRYIVCFLKEKLKLTLHPDKISIKTFYSGVDFLGWINFPDHRILRTVTKRRVFKRMLVNQGEQTRASYLGLLKHGNTFKLKKQIIGKENLLSSNV